jgi:hypothetical protein
MGKATAEYAFLALLVVAFVLLLIKPFIEETGESLSRSATMIETVT